MDHDFDLFVIGGGSGGVRAARISAGYGARVALAEERQLGGTCVNVGCVPKKLFVNAAHYGEDFEDARGYGWDSHRPAFDWNRLRANKDTEIGRLNGVYARLLEGKGVTVMNGRATVSDPHGVVVEGRRYSARHILVATGSWPLIPEIPGRELALSSNEMFHLESLPRRALIVGGGYIAVEFAGILHGLGVETALSYRGELFMRGFDPDLRAVLAEEMRAKGIDLRFGHAVTAIEAGPGGSRRVLCADGSTIETDLVLFATGRRPLTRGIGLEDCGVGFNADDTLAVDRWYATAVPSIHALGDIIPGPDLTPLATAQAMALASTLFLGAPRTVSLENIPTAVFSQPAIGTVGLAEDVARAGGAALRIYRTRFRPLRHTLSGNGERTFMKLVVDDASDRVLGVHMVGPEAGEIIQGMAVALQAGATKAVFDATLGIHPTSAEEFVTLREPA